MSLPIMTALTNSYTENLYAAIVFNGNDKEVLKQVGGVGIAYGSVVIPVKDPEQTVGTAYADGKITVVKGEDRVVSTYSSVEELKTQFIQ